MSSDEYANQGSNPSCSAYLIFLTLEKAESLAGAAILAEAEGREKEFFLDLRDFGVWGIMPAWRGTRTPTQGGGLWPTNPVN